MNGDIYKKIADALSDLYSFNSTGIFPKNPSKNIGGGTVKWVERTASKAFFSDENKLGDEIKLDKLRSRLDRFRSDTKSLETQDGALENYLKQINPRITQESIETLSSVFHNDEKVREPLENLHIENNIWASTIYNFVGDVYGKDPRDFKRYKELKFKAYEPNEPSKNLEKLLNDFENFCSKTEKKYEHFIQVVGDFGREQGFLQHEPGGLEEVVPTQILNAAVKSGFISYPDSLPEAKPHGTIGWNGIYNQNDINENENQYIKGVKYIMATKEVPLNHRNALSSAIDR